MSRGWVLAAILACVVAGWVTWTLLSGESAKEAGAATSSAPAVDAATEGPVRETAGSRHVGEAAKGAIQPRPFSESEPVAAKASAADEGRKLLVVLFPENTPAAGAIVDFTPVDSDDEGSEASAWSDLAAGKSVEIIADAKGVALLPDFVLGAFVRGRSGGRRGQMLLFGGPAPPNFRMASPTLRLQAPIAALVVNEAGAPQPDVPVAIADRDYPFGPVERGVTGRDGMAWLVLPQRPTQEKPPGPERAPTLSVALALPLSQPVEQFFDPDRPPTTPVQLVLPQCGRVVVKLRHADGAPFVDPATVRIRSEKEKKPMAFDDRPLSELSAAAEGGTASFLLVPLVGDLAVHAIPASLALRQPKEVVTGPRPADAETTVEITCGHLATIISGRLVDGAGKPVADAWIDASLPPASENDPRHLMFQRPAADGRFKLRFEVDPATVSSPEIQLGVVKFPPPGVGVFEHNPIKLTVRLPSAIRTGSADLGDVVVPTAGVLAAGTVVDQDGAPLPMAEVSVMRRTMMGWESEAHELKTASGADGTFELRGEAKRKRGLSLIARLSGWVCVDPAPFEPGASGVKVILTKAGGIEGSFKALGGRYWGRYSSEAPFQVVVTGRRAWIASRNDGESSKDYQLSVENGTFKTHELLPETYTVKLVGPDKEPLLVVKDVVVKAGEINRDPRLQNIDVTTFIASRVVTVVDDDEKPIEDAKVVAAEGEGASRKLTRFETGTDGRATVTTRASTVEVIVACKGYRAVELPKVTGDVTVTLRKGQSRPVTIRLGDSVALPSPPYSIRVSLKWLCGLDEPRPQEADFLDPRTDHFHSASFDAERTVTLEVQNPGIYEVVLWWSLEGPGHGGGRLDQTGGAALVTVSEDGAASVTVVPDPTALKRAIEGKKE